MANKEQVELLLKSVEEWNQWRKENQSVTPVLNDAILGRANLREVDLSGAILTGADLSEALLSEANLTGAILQRANLSSVNLRKANFSRANLSRAVLSDAILREINLQGADLSEATLPGAKLSGADLRDANLSGAELSGVNLRGAILRGADLHNVVLFETLFGNTDLRDVVGLEHCNHFGPSTIDHRTIELSGMLPDVFLRGCGLPDSLIDYLPSLLGEAISFYSCFISYSHEDKVFARRLHDQLQGKGIRCWLDEHQLLPGDDISKQVDRGIRLWDKTLLCCSEASLNDSWWTGDEIDKALEKERTLHKERGKGVFAIIPLNLDDQLFDWQDGRGATLRKRLAADFTGWEKNNDKFEIEFEKLVKALTADDGGREKPPVSKL